MKDDFVDIGPIYHEFIEEKGCKHAAVDRIAGGDEFNRDLYVEMMSRINKAGEEKLKQLFLDNPDKNKLDILNELSEKYHGYQICCFNKDFLSQEEFDCFFKLHPYIIYYPYDLKEYISEYHIVHYLLTKNADLWNFLGVFNKYGIFSKTIMSVLEHVLKTNKKIYPHRLLKPTQERVNKINDIEFRNQLILNFPFLSTDTIDLKTVDSDIVRIYPQLLNEDSIKKTNFTSDEFFQYFKSLIGKMGKSVKIVFEDEWGDFYEEHFVFENLNFWDIITINQYIELVGVNKYLARFRPKHLI